MRKLRIFTLILSLLLIMPNMTFAANNPTQTRLAGNDRYETACQIAKAGWTQSDYAILACGENYPDALAATPLAKKYYAPILLTDKNFLTPVTKKELLALHTKNVFIVGGNEAVSTAVANELTAMSIKVVRLAGQDRYDTAVTIAEQLENVNKVVVVSGEQYAGALSVASVAAKNNMPVLLVQSNNLPASVKAYMKERTISKTYVIGDISDDVVDQLPNTKKISGSNIYDINVNVLTEFDNEYAYDDFITATGQDFADALTGTAYAAMRSAPILLVNSNKPLKTIAFIKSKTALIKNLTILGGIRVISDSLASDYLSGNISDADCNNCTSIGIYNDNTVSNVTYTAREIAEKLHPSIVNIKTYDQYGKAIGVASGFVCDTNGNIGTNYHVIQGAYSAKVTLFDGQVYDVVKVLGSDPSNDIALLKIEATGLSSVILGDSDNIYTGDKIYAIGNPYGLDNTISDGLISMKNRTINETKYIQISAPMSPGSSGGALLNEKSQVIGITTAGIESAQELNFAIPINTFKTILTSNSNSTLKDLFGDKMSIFEFQKYLNQNYGTISIDNQKIHIDWQMPDEVKLLISFNGVINSEDYNQWKSLVSNGDNADLQSIFAKINSDIENNYPGKSWFGEVVYKYVSDSYPENAGEDDDVHYNSDSNNWEVRHSIAIFSCNKTGKVSKPKVTLNE